MTVTEHEVGRVDAPDDGLPVAHIPDDASHLDILCGGRATRALCGADMLGIPVADLPGMRFHRCADCRRIADRLGLRVLPAPNAR